MTVHAPDSLRAIPIIGMTPFRARIVGAGNRYVLERIAARQDADRERQRRAEAEALARRQADERLDAAVAATLRDGRNWHPATLILREVAAQHGVTVADIKGRSRKRPIILIRQEAAYRLVKEAKLSLPDTGRRLGGRDHTTILWAVRRHRSRLDRELRLRGEAQP